MSNPALGKLSIDLDARLAKFESDMGRAARITQREMDKMRRSVDAQLSKVNARLEGFAESIGGAIKGLLGGATVGAFGRLVKNAIDTADGFGKMAQKTGIAVERISALTYAAKLNGVEMGGLQQGLRGFAGAVVESTKNGTEMASVFKVMGINTRDASGNVRAMDSLLSDVADRFAGYEDGAAKAALAQKLFGKSGEAMIPLLNSGAEGIAALTDEAEKLGLVVTSETAEAAGVLNDSLDKLHQTTLGFANGIVTTLVPALSEYVRGQVDMIVQSGKAKEAGEETGEWLKKVVAGLIIAKNVIDVFAAGLSFMAKVAIESFVAAGRSIGAFIDWVKAAADVASNPFSDINIDEADQKFKDQLKEIAADWKAAFVEGAEGVGEAITQSQQDVGDALDLMSGDAVKVAKALADVEGQAKKTAPPIVDMGNAAREAAAELRAIQQAQADLAKMNERDLRAVIAYTRAMDKFTADHDELVKGYDDEIKLLRASAEEREALGIALEAETKIREENQRIIEQGLNIAPEVRAAQEAEIRARAGNLAIMRQQSEQADEYERMWEGAIGSVADAFGDLAAEGFKDWDGFLDSMLGTLKRWVQQVIAQLTQRALMNAFSGGGQGGWGAVFAGGLNAAGGGTGAYTAPATYTGGGASHMGPSGATGGAGAATGSGWTGSGAMAGYAAVGSYASQYVGSDNDAVSVGSGAVAGAAYGAMIGTYIMPGIGTAVGAIVGLVIGAIVGWVSAQDPALGVASTAGGITEGRVEGQARSAFGNIFVGKEDFDFDSQAFADQIKAFDDTIAQFLSGEEIAGVSAALANFDVHQGEGDIDPAAILEQRFDIILGQFSPAVQAFARAGATLEEQVQRFAEAIQLEKIFDDLDLDVGLTDLLEIVDTMGMQGEDFNATVQRIVGATKLLTDAFDIMNVDIGRTGTEFVEFAAMASEAAGGLDRLGQLTAGYFQHFYDSTDLIGTGLENLQDRATVALEGLGLAADISMEDFRTALETAMATMSPEELVTWLEAAELLGQVADAQAEYNAALIAAAQAHANYAAAVNDVRLEMMAASGFEVSAFVRSLSDIRTEEAQRIATLNELAVKAGMAGAAEADLALIHQAAALKASRAIAQLRAAAASLAQQLYGDDASGLDMSGTAISSLDSEASSMFASWENAIKSIRKFLDDILLDEQLTVLAPEQQLAEAQAQFNAAIAAAMGGDADAAASLPALARALLENARSFWSSGDEYDAIFASVMEALGGVLGVANPGGTGGGTTAIDNAAGQAELAADDVEQQRYLMAVELAQYIRDLADLIGGSVFDLTTELGVNLNEFVTDLGVNITNLSTETATQLADVANLLGIELSDLTDQLGISLGELSDANSYLNDALEGAIGAQPPEIRDLLEPLLLAVEQAVTDADATAAVEALEEAVNDVGGATAIALAPYLEGVDPPTVEQQLELLDRIGNTADQYLPSIDAWLENIAGSLAGGDEGDGNTPGFASGIATVPYDMTAQIHQGEMILDEHTATALREYGVSPRNTSTSSETKYMLRDLLSRMTEERYNSARREERLTSVLEQLARRLARTV